MKSIETNRPFKISIDAIKSILNDDKEISLISELKNSVFNKKEIVEVFDKSLFKDKYEWNIPTKIIDRYMTVKRKNIVLLESQIDNINVENLYIIDTKKTLKSEFKEIDKNINDYYKLIKKVIDCETESILKSLINLKSVNFILNAESIAKATSPLTSIFDKMFLGGFGWMKKESIVIDKPDILTEDEFERIKKYMMLTYSFKTNELKQYNYNDECIFDQYYRDRTVIDADDQLLSQFFNNNYPDDWYENQYSITIEEVNLDLPKIFFDWIYNKLDSEVFEKILKSDYFSDIKSKITEILSRYNGNEFNDLCKILQKDLENRYLNIDKIRSNMTPLYKSVLSDPNKGDWEVYEDALINNWLNTNNCEDFYFFARNPKLDIKRNAVCAIDFGTKSTVVAIRDKDERLLRVGNGNSYSDLRKEDFENPTFLYFQNFNEFNEDYKKRIGRPFTKWSDVLVSHEAASKFYDEIDDEKSYYATFNELKQWANTKNRHQILIDKSGNRVKLNSYLNLTSNANFDPIELYAYYLGLYINNYNNGIYLHYTLSFPVNYGVKIQEKLLNSFERGLKKSLPPSILSDSNIIEEFEIYAGASEPAAYAISALETYGLEPNSNEEIAYGVFDFGGGTTDFDFGIERKPKDGRRRFDLVQFGKGGNPYLGGENLLQLLAYEVYKCNESEMRRHQIQIVLPAKGRMQSGLESLVLENGRATNEAYTNMRILMEVLRPIWEETEGYLDEFNEGRKTVKLYVEQDGSLIGKDIPLTINVEELRKILEANILDGVNGFINQMMNTFANRNLTTYPIHIFLAGNSCQSKLLQEIFVRELMAKCNDFINSNKKNKNSNKSILYKLYPPLGTNFDINSLLHIFNTKDEKTLLSNILYGENLLINDSLDRVKTGKTGVVFGLLRSRRGGKDIRIINENITDENEITFPYYLGVEYDNHVFRTVIPKSINYDKWEPFEWADEDRFELHYTSDDRALTDSIPISETESIVCKIKKCDIDENKKIFIKRIGIDKIQYCVAYPDTFDNNPGEADVYNAKLGGN
ncbi:hypothetical protein [uncultured Veillonella sp.]|uniref:hypothetical protein n=1 Tax=uncultured Veillonella sp. TaxID=159268 RepID=UPI0025E9C3EE|nr:hypothetical protein [uncultured Veillonella sp.]